MTYVDDGIEALQNKGIRDGTATYPSILVFAGEDNTFTGTETSITNDYVNKAVTWTSTGIQSKYTVELTSLEAIGSTIECAGLIGADDTLITIDEAFIGLKSNSFDVQVEGEIHIRRPV